MPNMQKNEQIQLTLPCHWDKGVIEDIVSSSENLPKISEVYGVLANGGPVGHGRIPESVIQISRDQVKAFKLWLNQRSINFTYLLNAPFSFSGPEQKKQLDEYLDWTLNNLKPNALTVSSHELMRYIRKKDQQIALHISTIAGVKTARDLQQYLDVGPARIVPHHDCGKRWENLQEIIKLGHKYNIEVEILSTESCLLGCPNRQAHYTYTGKKSSDSKFHTTCNSTKLTWPREFLMAGGVIRPEDTKMFHQMGVRYFKISGRSKPASWLPEVVKAYTNGYYHGNLIRLLGIDPELRAEEWIYLDNDSLDGFLERYPQNTDRATEEKYCDGWITKLYQTGAFKLLDGTEYQISDQGLKIKKIGKKAAEIIKKENYPK